MSHQTPPPHFHTDTSRSPSPSTHHTRPSTPSQVHSTSSHGALTPTQLSTRLYSEQLLRYQSQSILQAQKLKIQEFVKKTRDDVTRMQDALENAHERETRLLQERDQYRARFLAAWQERREWRVMQRCFGKWREMVWKERERQMQQKMREMRSFWVWRGMSQSATKCNVSQRHRDAVAAFVTDRARDRLLKCAFDAWRGEVRDSRENRMNESKLQVVRKATASLLRDGGMERVRNAPHVPALALGAKMRSDHEVGSDSEDETTYIDPRSIGSDHVLSEDNIHTVTIDLQEPEAGKNYLAQFGSFEYVSPRRVNGRPTNDLPFIEDITASPTQIITAPKSPRRARLSAKQQRAMDRLSQPRHVSERVHSLDAGHWKALTGASEMPLVCESRTPRREVGNGIVSNGWSTPNTYTTLSAGRSSSAKKQRASSTKKARSSSAKKRRTKSARSSPLQSPRLYESVLHVANGSSAASPRGVKKAERIVDASESDMYVSPTKKPRLTEEDKRRIREILESEGA